MIRGSNIEDIFSVAPDWESYTFTPIDYKKDHDLIEKVWSWEGQVEGLECADGKSASDRTARSVLSEEKTDLPPLRQPSSRRRIRFPARFGFARCL